MLLTKHNLGVQSIHTRATDATMLVHLYLPLPRSVIPLIRLFASIPILPQRITVGVLLLNSLAGEKKLSKHTVRLDNWAGVNNDKPVRAESLYH